MASADAIWPLTVAALAAEHFTAVLLASIRAYRRAGRAIEIVERARRTPHRPRISLGWYALLRDWTITRAARLWRTSGAWLRSSIAVSLWEARS